MKKIILILLIGLIAAGCERTFDTNNVGFEPPDEISAPIALKVFHLPDGIRLSWAVHDTSEVSFFRVYYTQSEDDGYILWDTTSAFELDVTGLSSGITYLFRVATVTSGGVESPQSTSVSTSPGIISVSINNDAEYTNSRQLSVRFVVPATPNLVLLSEDSLGTAASWRNFAQPSTFTVSEGDGVKRVFARFRFTDGSESVESVGDSIILDTRAQIDSVWFTSSTPTPAVGDTIMFYIDAGEDGGEAFIDFPGLSNLTLYDDAGSGDAIADDGIYSRRYIVPLNIQVDDGVVTGHFSDRANNNATSEIAGDRLNIPEAVDPITLRAVAETSYRVRLDWDAVSSSDFVSYRIYRSTTTGVDDSSELVTIITSRTTITYSDENVAESQPYFYRVYAYGSEGELTNSTETSVTTPANQIPAGVSLAVTVGSEDALQIALTWTQNSDDDFQYYRIFRGTNPGVTDLNGQPVAVINTRTQTSFTDYRANASTDYYYVIYVYDIQGARSDPSNEENTL